MIRHARLTKMGLLVELQMLCKLKHRFMYRSSSVLYFKLAYRQKTVSHIITISYFQNRRAKSPWNGTLQVVPDIEEPQSENEQRDSPIRRSHGYVQIVPDIDEPEPQKEQKTIPPKPTNRDLMNQSITAGQKTGPNAPLIARRRPPITLQPTIQRLNSDARPLSPAEVIAHRRLLQHQSSRRQSPQRIVTPQHSLSPQRSRGQSPLANEQQSHRNGI